MIVEQWAALRRWRTFYRPSVPYSRHEIAEHLRALAAQLDYQDRIRAR